jgi:hypothetical protein
MTPNYPHLAQRLFNVPLAITPGKVEVIMAALADRMGLAKLMRPTGEVVMLSDFDLTGERGRETGRMRLSRASRLIPVSRARWCRSLGCLHPTAA